MIQANSLLLNFQMKSPCYLVTLSLESSDFQTFLKQYVILVPFGALIYNVVIAYLPVRVNKQILPYCEIETKCCCVVVLRPR